MHETKEQQASLQLRGQAIGLDRAVEIVETYRREHPMQPDMNKMFTDCMELIHNEAEQAKKQRQVHEDKLADLVEKRTNASA